MRVMRGGAYYGHTGFPLRPPVGVYTKPFGAFSVGVRAVRMP